MKYILYYFMAINVSAFYIMYSDKKRARRGDWRISERTIFVLAVLGGSPGVLLGMKAFRHKTLHKRFSVGIPAIMILQLLIIIFLIYRLT